MSKEPKKAANLTVATDLGKTSLGQNLSKKGIGMLDHVEVQPLSLVAVSLVFLVGLHYAPLGAPTIFDQHEELLRRPPTP